LIQQARTIFSLALYEMCGRDNLMHSIYLKKNGDKEMNRQRLETLQQ
jgi:hypothetical protein